MRVERVSVHRFEIPLSEPFVTALKPIPELERVLVEVETDTGLVGYGEGAPAYEVTGETQGSTAAVLEDVLAPLVLGSDPLAVERVVSGMEALIDGAPAHGRRSRSPCRTSGANTRKCRSTNSSAATPRTRRSTYRSC
jgi:L-alanine-DL-glutamate epimerase-like enolase superfamily enzyme